MFNQFRRVAASMLAALLIGQFPLAQAETRSYQHDNSGNFTQCSVTIGNSAPAITNYTYDALNRLQTESGPNKIQTITYDEDGNRLSDGAGSYTYSTTSNRMLTRLGVTVVTDAAGNITADGTGRTFTYNQAGQLSSVSKNNVLLASYYYDADGRRSHKVTTANAPQGAQSILYDYDPQGNLWYEIDATTNTPIRTYFWNPDSNAPIGYADYKPSRKIFYFAADHLKTPRMVMDDTGKVVWRWESDAFGSTPANEDPDGDGVKVTMNLRFPGQYYDQESGLHYNYHRYYDPAVGRYTQADPIGIRGGLNGYTYVANNPLRWTDPLGLLDPKNDPSYYPLVKNDAANRLNKNVPPSTPTIPSMDRQQTIEFLSKEITDRMTVDEADSCNPIYHPFGYKAATKKVGQRILDDMKKDHPNYPWKDWEPYFDKIWQ